MTRDVLVVREYASSTAPATSIAGTATPLPKGPVLGWSTWAWLPVNPSTKHDIAHRSRRIMVTSGRAAILLALKQLRLPSASVVLVPSYHCPTMVAPVLLAGLQPDYYAIDSDGLPDFSSVSVELIKRVKVVLVAHYFGLPRSLAKVRNWCDVHGVALIEDCAHCLYGQAGALPVGGWGDFATASISKFLPVLEAGLLISRRKSIPKVRQVGQGLHAQIKGCFDLLEYATAHDRLRGLGWIVALCRMLKKPAPQTWERSETDAGPGRACDAQAAMAACDMGRSDKKPLLVSMLLYCIIPTARMQARRLSNYNLYAQQLEAVAGAHPLFKGPAPSGTVPYVFPLWVDDADQVYGMARQSGLPVYRWDRPWPDRPSLPGDSGPGWNQHVLQLLCHQDLSAKEIEICAKALIGMIHLASADTQTLANREGPKPHLPAAAIPQTPAREAPETP